MRILAVVLGAAMFSSGAFGQSTGSITGTVTDPAGAVVVNAPVETRNADTGAIFRAATTDTGNYTLSGMPAGNYELSVSAPGFKKYVRQGLAVQSAQTERIDVALQVGTASESVTVTEAAALLKTDSGDLSHNVTSDRVIALPALPIGAQGASNLGLRNPEAVIQFVPGSYFASNTDMKVNGAPNNTRATRIEGIDSTPDFMGFTATLYQPSVDAVQETSVLTSNYGAEYGVAGGGIVSYTMKSGSNAYHGTAYDYFVDEFLNAGTPYTNNGNGGLLRPEQRRNDFGFTLGGPMSVPKVYNGKDRTFFFFNWEQYMETQYINNQPQVVPTNLMRQGIFTQIQTNRNLGTDPLGRPILENTIYDPMTERPASATNPVLVRDPFPSNTIPLSRQDPVALKIQNMIPLAQNSGLVNNAIFPWHSPQLTTIPAFKVDQYFGPNNKVSVYWSTMDANSRQPATQLQQVDGIQAITLNNVDGYSGPDVVSSSRGNFLQSYTTRVNYDRTISPTLVAHLGLGYIKLNLSSDALNTDFNQAQIWGLTGAPGVRGAPVINGGSNAFGGMKNMGASGQNYDHNEKTGISPNLTWVKGDHTFKFGSELIFNGYPSTSNSYVPGNFTLSAAETGLPSTNGQNLGGGAVGFPYASFLLGLMDSVTVAPYESLKLGKHSVSFFAQDSWKIRRNITLDYGLRYDYQTYMTETDGRMPSFSPTTPDTAAGGLLGSPIWMATCKCTFAKNYPLAFAPRLGLAWSVTPKDVIRAGFGILFASTALDNRVTVPDGGETFVVPAGSNGFDEPAMKLSNGIPQIASTWPVYNASIYPNQATIAAVDQNAGRPARQTQWSIGAQHELTHDTVIEAAYVGNVGVWWPSTTLTNYNSIPVQELDALGLDPTVAANRTILTSQIGSATAINAGFGKLPYAGFPTTATVAQSLRPYPQFGNISALWAPLGKTWYDGLQSKLTQRLQHGVSLTGTFSLQKSLNEGSSSNGGTADGVVTNIFNRGVNKDLSGLDQHMVLAFQTSYTVPTLKADTGYMKVASLVTRDWTVGAVLSYASGLPILAPASNNSLSSVLFQSTYEQRVPGAPLYTVPSINCHCYDPSNTFVLNSAAWTDAPAGTFGGGAPYYTDYRYQRRPLENGSLARQFRITERVRLNLRVEFNNIFNRATPPNPTSTNAQATQTRAANGITTGGFGYINTAAVAGGVSGLSGPRNGTIVARFTF